MKLEYIWQIGERSDNNFGSAPITTPTDELKKLVEESQQSKYMWHHIIGLQFTYDGEVKQCMNDSYRVRKNMFMFPEYIPFCRAVIAWLEQNVKQSVTLDTRVRLRNTTSEVMELSIRLKTPYVSKHVTVSLPHMLTADSRWSWNGKGWEHIPFRGDWVGLTKSVCNRLSRLELMQDSVPPTSLRDLLAK
jgi:hypothetical protein